MRTVKKQTKLNMLPDPPEGFTSDGYINGPYVLDPITDTWIKVDPKDMIQVWYEDKS